MTRGGTVLVIFVQRSKVIKLQKYDEDDKVHLQIKEHA